MQHRMTCTIPIDQQPGTQEVARLTTDNLGQHVVSEGDLLLHPEIANKVDNILSGFSHPKLVQWSPGSRCLLGPRV